MYRLYLSLDKKDWPKETKEDRGLFNVQAKINGTQFKASVLKLEAPERYKDNDKVYDDILDLHSKNSQDPMLIKIQSVAREFNKHVTIISTLFPSSNKIKIDTQFLELKHEGFVL